MSGGRHASRRHPPRGRVVLLGGGYVTLHAYRELARRLGRAIRAGDVEVVIVSADDCHSFHGFTGEALSGVLPFRRTRTPIARACPLARFVPGHVLSLDRKRRVVTYVDREGLSSELAYDHVIVGLGGREPVERVPGLREHGFTLRRPGDIERLCEAVAGLVAAAPLPGSAGPDRLGGHAVVVAGGGLAGVELAAAIAVRGEGRLRVELVHPGSALLPRLRTSQPRLAGRAQRELDRLGVRVRPMVRLARVTPMGAELRDGTFVPAAIVVGTIGERPVSLAGLGEEFRDELGRLITGADLSVAEGVWAAGDCARVLRVGSDEPVPANALWAIKAGAHIGRNVARVLAARPTRPFRYPGLGQAASFGTGRSIAELYGVPFTGAVAWLLRLAFFLRFMPSRRTALAVVGDLLRKRAPERVAAADLATEGPQQRSA